MPPATSADPFPLRCEKTQCPIRIRNELLKHEQRAFKYSRPSKMMGHVEGHLPKLAVNDNI